MNYFSAPLRLCGKKPFWTTSMVPIRFKILIIYILYLIPKPC
jgi:hypothetical protein